MEKIRSGFMVVDRRPEKLIAFFNAGQTLNPEIREPRGWVNDPGMATWFNSLEEAEDFCENFFVNYNYHIEEWEVTSTMHKGKVVFSTHEVEKDDECDACMSALVDEAVDSLNRLHSCISNDMPIGEALDELKSDLDVLLARINDCGLSKDKQVVYMKAYTQIDEAFHKELQNI